MKLNLNFSDRKKLSKQEREYLKKIEEQKRMIKDLNKAFNIIELIDKDEFQIDENKESLPKQLHMYKNKYFEMKNILLR